MHDEEATEENENNIENMMMFFDVDSADDLPELPENCMVFIENIWSITIAGITYVHRTTIVMDEDKYCMYSFNGVSYGVSGVAHDYCETVGYVYNVEDVSDFCGFFYGGSFNEMYRISGGAVATNGVYSEIISGVGYGSASLGLIITHYSTPSGDWTYGKASIRWRQTPYSTFNNPLRPWNYTMIPLEM